MSDDREAQYQGSENGTIKILDIDEAVTKDIKLELNGLISYIVYHLTVIRQATWLRKSDISAHFTDGLNVGQNLLV